MDFLASIQHALDLWDDNKDNEYRRRGTVRKETNGLMWNIDEPGVVCLQREVATVQLSEMLMPAKMDGPAS